MKYALAGFVLLAAVGAFAYLKLGRDRPASKLASDKPAEPRPSETHSTNPPQPATSPGPAARPASTSPPPATAASPAPPGTNAVPAKPKSVEDFQISNLMVQRPKGTKGSKLIYLVGLLTNNSDSQRLGVKVELDLFDMNGAKVDTATDYRDSVAPRESWTMRALVRDPRAVSAKLASIKEDP